jgi:tetratricopeptide (TPR) repeat protein
MMPEDRGFELYLKGLNHEVKGNFKEAISAFESSLELIKEGFERGLVLNQMGRVYFEICGSAKYTTGVNESGSSSFESDDDIAFNTHFLDKALECFRSASDCLSGNDRGKVEYQISIALHTRVLNLRENGQFSETKGILLDTLNHLKTGVALLSSVAKLDYCFFMHLTSSVCRELYELTKEQHYLDSAKECCASAVKVITQNHFEEGLRFVLDDCLSF